MLFSFLLSSQLYAFTLFGSYSNLTGFKVNDLYVYLNNNSCPTSLSSNLTEAIDTWNRTPMSRLKLHFGGSTSTPASDLRLGNFDERVTIACSTQFQIDSQDQSGSNGCSGSCLDRVYARAGVFADNNQNLSKSYIVINMNSSAQARFDSLSSQQQQITLAHELGHTLGLGHSEDSEALMYAYIDNKSELILSRDDQEGMAFLYPYDRTLGCGNLKNSAPWFLFLFLLPLWILFLFRISNASHSRKLLQKNS